MAAQNPGTPRVPRPSPRALAGKAKPALKVRPVDWTATGARPSATSPAPSATGAGPSAPGAAPSTSRKQTPATPGPAPRPRPRARTVELPRPLPAPPAGAVHSLQPSDPRPNLRPLTIDEGEIRTVGVFGLTSEQVIEVVADPEEAWTADAGTSDHFLRGALVVQVRRADNAVIGAFSARYALSVRPEEYESALDIADDAAGRSARGGRGTRHPTTRRELIDRMEEAGFVITAGASHGRVSHPKHPGLFVPLASTPSDVRFTRHAVAQIRRVFGIDLRR
ncbi:hypothetical protein Bequi_13720 [Brachybacterium sp. JHP9]|uniref:Type II toxin-antitoxin system HicA family toxin n=1 Tax=Brachybacterium equifaecis TaxID=2910770 RepID=A0ABT0R3A3_9MICO|nr:hypothetical protein [Brachybacterium equifaecis]MCL6424423.1 hypothetical protein [Brachybacterium equifaecis]